SLFVSFFFLQAVDGIRDFHVTGVQTCALPILYVPADGYLAKAKALCEKYNVLFIADEVQTGIARTGKMLAMDHEGVKADILILRSEERRVGEGSRSRTQW